MIFGTDTSSYQPLGSYDPGAFEIINALDPTLPRKVSTERPWGIYSWVFPGEHGSYPVGRALAALAKTGADHAPLGLWWDYEDNGVVQSQLDQAFATADQEGHWSGYYSNDWRVDHGPLMARPFWLAAYPGANDGTFPGVDAMRSSRPVNIWQFTSTNGTLDQNVIVDEAWFAALDGAAPAPESPKEYDMLIRNAQTGARLAVAGFDTFSYRNLPSLPESMFVPLDDDEWVFTLNALADSRAKATATVVNDAGAPLDITTVPKEAFLAELSRRLT